MIINRETSQRKKILEILCSTKSHPTADWIYERAKREFPRLSLGTVYRNLKILKQQCRIQELPFGDTFDRFDGNAIPHPHFVCKKCCSVYDIEMEQPSQDLTIKEEGFQVDECKITLYGICVKCKMEF